MEETFLTIFGGRLREQRKQLGLNQEQLADACGVSRPMFGRYERGAAAPGAEVLAALQAQGFDIPFLLGDDAPSKQLQPALTAEEQVLLDYFRAASREVRRAALGALMGAAPGGVSGIGHQSGGVSQVVSGNGNVVAGGTTQGVPPPRKRPTR